MKINPVYEKMAWVRTAEYNLDYYISSSSWSNEHKFGQQRAIQQIIEVSQCVSMNCAMKLRRRVHHK